MLYYKSQRTIYKYNKVSTIDVLEMNEGLEKNPRH